MAARLVRVDGRPVGGAVARRRRLNEFLDEQLTQVWEWGRVDCCLMCADWVAIETGHDPAAEFRGAYADAEQAHDLIRLRGGFMPLLGWLMDRAGFEVTQAPAVGDVGIVTAPIMLMDRMPAVGAVAAIRSGNGIWCVRAYRGLQWGGYPMVTAWRLP